MHIGGEHRQVGVLPGGGPHQGALALIPAAAAAEHRDDAARGHRPEGLQGLGQGLRRVGKVDEDAAAQPRGRYRLHAAGNGGRREFTVLDDNNIADNFVGECYSAGQATPKEALDNMMQYDFFEKKS